WTYCSPPFGTTMTPNPVQQVLYQKNSLNTKKTKVKWLTNYNKQSFPDFSVLSLALLLFTFHYSADVYTAEFSNCLSVEGKVFPECMRRSEILFRIKSGSNFLLFHVTS